MTGVRKAEHPPEEGCYLQGNDCSDANRVNQKGGWEKETFGFWNRIRGLQFGIKGWRKNL